MTQDISPHTGHELAEQTTFDRTVAIVLDTLSPPSRRVYGPDLPRLAAVRY